MAKVANFPIKFLLEETQGTNMTRIQICVQVTFPELKLVEPKISTLKIYNVDPWKNEELQQPQQWVVPIHAMTHMGVVDGSITFAITELKAYSSEEPYHRILWALSLQNIDASQNLPLHSTIQ